LGDTSVLPNIADPPPAPPYKLVGRGGLPDGVGEDGVGKLKPKGRRN